MDTFDMACRNKILKLVMATLRATPLRCLKTLKHGNEAMYVLKTTHCNELRQ